MRHISMGYVVERIQPSKDEEDDMIRRDRLSFLRERSKAREEVHTNSNLIRHAVRIGLIGK